jgi:hypothetical protein
MRGQTELKREIFQSHRCMSLKRVIGGGVQKPVEFIDRFQFRPVQHTRAPARKIAKIELAERGGFESTSMIS